MSLQDALAGEPNAADILLQYQAMSGIHPVERWLGLSVYLMRQGASFRSHLEVWKECFTGADLRPVWFPREEVSESNIGRFLAESDLTSYQQLHDWSISKRDAFWQTSVERLGIAFRTRPESIVDLSDGLESPNWLPGANLNIVESCFSGGRGQRSDRDERTGWIASKYHGCRTETAGPADRWRIARGGLSPW